MAQQLIDLIAPGDSLPAGGLKINENFTELYNFVDDAPLNYAPLVHVHAITDVTGLTAALAAKLDSSGYTAADVLAKLLTVDGTGSGIDADLLDGLSSAAFLAAASYTAADVLTKLLTVDGAGSGLDADLLDGASSASFLQTSSYQALTPTWANLHTFSTTPAVPNSSWTYAKIQNVSATARVLGRVSAGAGVIEELTGAQIATLASYTAADVLAKLLTVDGAGSLLDADLLDGLSSAAFLQTSTYQALTPTWSAAHTFSLTPTVPAASWTYAKIQNVSATARVLGRVTAGAGVIEELTGAQVATLITYTAADVLTKLLTVDGAGTGLDADLLDGLSSAAFLQGPAGANTQVQFNDGGVLGTSAALAFDKATNLLTVGTAGAFGGILGAPGAATSAGEVLYLSGGDGGATLGTGGALLLRGGLPTDGAGGAINLSGRAGATTTGANRNGGAVASVGGAGVNAGAGGAMTVTGGAGGDTGAGGAATISGGAGGATSGAGGAIIVRSGASTDGVSGAATLQSQAALGTNRASGVVTVSAGNASGSATAGAINITGGVGGATGIGSAITVTAGAGGTTSGAGGAVSLAGGNATSGIGGAASLSAGSSGATAAGASVNLTARAGVGTNQAGGSVNIIPGAATGTGAPGCLTILPLPVNAVNDAAAATALIPVGGIYRNGSVLMVRVA